MGVKDFFQLMNSIEQFEKTNLSKFNGKIIGINGNIIIGINGNILLCSYTKSAISYDQ
jgi:hypothetical protein